MKLQKNSYVKVCDNEKVLNGIKKEMEDSKLIEIVTGHINHDLQNAEYLYKEVMRLQKTINDISETINNEKWDWKMVEHILQIIDKALGDEDDEC